MSPALRSDVIAADATEEATLEAACGRRSADRRCSTPQTMRGVVYSVRISADCSAELCWSKQT